MSNYLSIGIHYNYNNNQLKFTASTNRFISFFTRTMASREKLIKNEEHQPENGSFIKAESPSEHDAVMAEPVDPFLLAKALEAARIVSLKYSTKSNQIVVADCEHGHQHTALHSNHHSLLSEQHKPEGPEAAQEVQPHENTSNEMENSQFGDNYESGQSNHQDGIQDYRPLTYEDIMNMHYSDQQQHQQQQSVHYADSGEPPMTALEFAAAVMEKYYAQHGNGAN